MAKYINKAAVVAEIERRKQKLLDNIIFESDKEWAVRTAHQLNRIIMFLDTLEVKEVDEEPTSIDISVLLAEIEREYKSLSNATNDFAMGRKAELKNLLSFIESIYQQ